MGQINPFAGIPPLAPTPVSVRRGRRVMEQHLPKSPDDTDLVVEDNQATTETDNDSGHPKKQRDPHDTPEEDQPHIDLTA